MRAVELREWDEPGCEGVEGYYEGDDSRFSCVE